MGQFESGILEDSSVIHDAEGEGHIRTFRDKQQVVLHDREFIELYVVSREQPKQT